MRPSVVGIGILACLAFSFGSGAQEVNTIRLPDPELERVIRAELGKPEGSLGREDMGKLTELDASRNGFAGGGSRPPIRSLKGLEHAKNLRRVSFRNVPELSPGSPVLDVADFGPIMRISNLEEIDLSGNPVRELEVPDEWSRVRMLRLAECELRHLRFPRRTTRPRYGAPRLRYLDVSHNHLESVTIPSHLADGSVALFGNPLRTVWIPLGATLVGRAEISDSVDSLRNRGVEVVETIHVPDSGLWEGLEIEGLIQGDEVSLEQFRSMKTVYACCFDSGPGTYSLAGLEHAENLRELILDGAHLQDLTPLQHLRHLERLTITYSTLEVSGEALTAALAGLNSLKYFSLWRTGFGEAGQNGVAAPAGVRFTGANLADGTVSVYPTLRRSGLSPAGFTFELHAGAGAYRVEKSDDLEGWTNHQIVVITPEVIAEDTLAATVQISDLQVEEASSRYYRVVPITEADP